MTHLALSIGLLLSAPAMAEAPEDPIHEELRGIVAGASDAINAQRWEEILPLLTDDFRGTLINQAVVSGPQGVVDYHHLWFGPDGYMESLTIAVEPDALTELSDDRTWGLARGNAHEHYVAKNGDTFDFETRWTAVVVLDDDGEWKLRAIHFGTNHLDNPVLWKVRDTMILYGAIGAVVLCFVVFWMGWFMGRHRKTT